MDLGSFCTSCIYHSNNKCYLLLWDTCCENPSVCHSYKGYPIVSTYAGGLAIFATKDGKMQWTVELIVLHSKFYVQ